MINRYYYPRGADKELYSFGKAVTIFLAVSTISLFSVMGIDFCIDKYRARVGQEVKKEYQQEHVASVEPNDTNLSGLECGDLLE